MAAAKPRKTHLRKIGVWFPVAACLLLTGMVWAGFRQYEAQRMNDRLFAALQAANPAAVSEALKQGANPNSVTSANYRDGGYSSLFHQWFNQIFHPGSMASGLSVAVENENPRCVRLLLDAGADPNRHDSGGMTPLMWAARGGGINIPVLRLLLDKGANVNTKDASGVTALGYSIDENSSNGSGDLSVPRFLLDHGAKADVVGQFSPGDTLLRWCVRNGSKNTVPLMNLLLDHGADPNQTDGLGWPILLRASQWITPEIVKSLLDHGANPNTDPAIDETPLMEAVRQKQIVTLKLLLAKGADVNTATKSDSTALVMAAQEGEPRTVDLLLKHGANPNYVNSFEMCEPALVMASFGLDITSVKLLLAHGADPNLSGEDLTPLTAAADGSLSEAYKIQHIKLSDAAVRPQLPPLSPPAGMIISQMLLNAGAKATAANHEGNTALVFAVQGHNLPLVRLLLAHGANPTAYGANPYVPKSASESPLKLATERGYTDLLPLLQPPRH